MQSAPSQEAAPPLPDGDPQQLPPPLPGEDWRQHNSAAAPPLPEEPPPLPQPGPSGAAPWAAPPGSGQQPGLTGSQPAPLAAPPWAAQQQGMQAPLPHTQQPPWSAHGAYPGHAHPGTYQQQQPAAPSPYAQMYGQAWAGQPPGMQQHHHHQAYAGAPAYPAPGYANLYPATPYQGMQYAGGMAYPGAQPQQHAYGYQPPAWGAAAQQPRYPQQQQPSWAAAAASNGHMHVTQPLPASPVPQAAMQAAAPLPSPERRPPAPANVAPVESLLSGPGRAKRPKRIAVVLRGLPGSGKSHAARRLRDTELAAGAPAPRIHSIDDYFVTEVEREVWEDEPGGKRRRRTLQRTEYCFEADMEGVYKGSLLKAFRRTVEEARFGFVIVDANNLQLEDCKPYWDAGQRAGYEVYMMQMPEASVQVCHARNVHGRTEEEIAAAAARWEVVPPSMPQLDAAAWLKGLGKSQESILEVDMEDDRGAPAGQAGASEDDTSAGASRASKWASFDDAEARAAKRAKRAQSAPTHRSRPEHDVPSALRGPGRRKSVRWADEADGEEAGFSIGGAALRQLETVYVLEGLGPPKDGAAAARSFAEQVKEDHKSEQRNFRDILLGHARPF